MELEKNLISKGCFCCFAGHGTEWVAGHEPAQSPQHTPTLWSLWGQESSCAGFRVVSRPRSQFIKQ